MISGDNITDLEVGRDREVFVGADGDLSTVSGQPQVEQSVALDASSALRTLIGEPLTGGTYERAQSALTDAFQRDTQIADVRRVEVKTVDRADGLVTVEVFVNYDESFDVALPAPDA